MNRAISNRALTSRTKTYLIVISIKPQKPIVARINVKPPELNIALIKPNEQIAK